MRTIADFISDKQREIDRQKTILQRRVEVLEELPPHVPLPTVANEDTHYFGQPAAWVSFAHPFGYRYTNGGDAYDPVAILQAFENYGFVGLPVSLTKWDNYLRAAEPGAPADIPDTKSNWAREKKDCVLIAPVWIEPCEHTGCDAECYYRAPSGRVLRVGLDIPNLAMLRARRRSSPGCECASRFIDGSGELRMPERWRDFHVGDSHITINKHSHCRVINDGTALDGEIFFDVAGPYPKASQMLEALLAKPEEDKDANRR